MRSEANLSLSGAGHTCGQFAAAYRVLQEAIEARAFPGCAFGVLAGGRVAVQDALGRHTYEEDAPAVTADTVYDLASVTKVVATTAAAMLLSQRKQINLDTRLGEILPAFLAGRAKDDPARHVQLRHLLAHSSGLPDYVEFFRTAATPEALLYDCLGLPLLAEPGTRAAYSDPGFILLGKAFEAQTGESLSVWLEREVFAPLGMMATGYCPEPSARSSIPPTEEDTTFRKRRIQGEVQDENAWVLNGVAGHAGVFSNIPDLMKFAGAVLGTATVNAAGSGNASGVETHLFDREIVKLFAQRQMPEGSSRALGWDTPSENSSSGRRFGPHSIGHLGYSGCSIWIDLDAAIAVALLTNRTWPDRQNQLIRAVRPAFHDAVREAL